MISHNDKAAANRVMGREEPLVAEVGEPVAEALHPAADPEPVVDDATPGAEVEPTHTILRPSLRRDVPVNYLGAVLAASLALILASSLGALSWFVSSAVMLILLSTLVEGWRMVTISAAAALAGTMLFGLVSTEGDSRVDTPTVNATLPRQDALPAIPGSLGVYVSQVPELWNTVDSAPQINKGLTRSNETGEYDAFIFRFGQWGRVAGAYDPANDAVYALLVTGQFSGAGTDQLYLHLCFVVAPYSPECIDSYRTHGLGGGTLQDYVDMTHDAEWTVGEHTWRLQIDQNVLTIRVFGEDTA